MTSDNPEVRHRTGNKLPSHSESWGDPSRVTEKAGLTMSIYEPCGPSVTAAQGKGEMLTAGMAIQLTATHALDATASVPQSALIELL